MATNLINLFLQARKNIMSFKSSLEEMAKLSDGTTRALIESSLSAYTAIFEGEDDVSDDETVTDDELSELSALGEELAEDENEENSDENGENQENAEKNPDENVETEEIPDENKPEPAPETVNQQSNPTSVSPEELIKELVKLGYPETIKEVAQQMKEKSSGKTPTAEDMLRPVAMAVSSYMKKKGYSAMQKEDSIKVVKTLVMMATKQKEAAAKQAAASEKPEEEEKPQQ